ncbi:MAG: molecular chaperone DnaJ [bacterium]|nr:molecular chaperone DnaJ [bacterium]
MSKDYYKILGVDKGAKPDDIKKAFRKLAHQYHPDKGSGNADKFKEASEAYSVLSDDKKRAEYDTYGQTFAGGGPSQGAGQGFGGFDFSGFGGQQGGGFDFSQNGFEFDLGDIFGDFFGGGGREKVKRGRDISIDVELPFSEAVFGTERKILLSKTSRCEDCDGGGAKRGTEMHTCAKCNGKGKVHETKRSFLGNFSTVRVCDDCQGKGKVPKEKCPTCHGLGVLKQQEEVSVAIPAGIDDGEMIRLTGGGEAVASGASGDLYIKVHVKRHPVFRKEGANLIIDLSLKLSTALLGEEYSLQTLDGEIKVKIPEGVSHGEILRVKGKGVPYEKGKRGDLLIHLSVKLPTKLSKEGRKLIEELRKEGI